MTATLPDGMEFKNMMVQACTDAVDSAGVWGSQFPEVDGVRNHIIAVTGVRDEVGDIILPGAFHKTLQRITPKACLGHDWNRAIGEPEAIEELLPGDPRLPREDRFGQPWNPKAGALFARTRYNLAKKDGQDAYADATFHGPRLACSIGYVDPKDDNGNPIHSYKAIDPDTGLMTRFLPELQLFEYSQVLHGAHLLAGGLKTGKPKRLELKVRPSMELKVRLVRDSAYWGLPLGTPIRPGMKPQGPKARRIAATGQQASDTAGAVEVDANNLRVKPTAKGKLKGDQAIENAYGSTMGLIDYADPLDDPDEFVDDDGNNPLDTLVANALPPAEVEDHLRNNSDWDTSRLGDAADRQDEIESFIASVVDAYREKYNAELVRQNDNGDSEVADPDASEVAPDTETAPEAAAPEGVRASDLKPGSTFVNDENGLTVTVDLAEDSIKNPGYRVVQGTDSEGEVFDAVIKGDATLPVAPTAPDAQAATGTPPAEEPVMMPPDFDSTGKPRQGFAIPPPPADLNAPKPLNSGPDLNVEVALHNGDPVNVRRNDGQTANIYNMRTEQMYDVPASELLTGGASVDDPVMLKLTEPQREAASLAFDNGEPAEASGAEFERDGTLRIVNIAEAVNSIDMRFEIFEDNPDERRMHARALKAVRAKIVKLAKPGEPVDAQAAPSADDTPGATAPVGDAPAGQPLPGNEDVVPEPSIEAAPEPAPGESTVEPGLAPDTAGEPLGETDPALDAPAEPGAEQPIDDLRQPLEPGAAEEIAPEPEPTDTITADEIADTEQSTDASFGVTEAPDGEFEADDDIADRQDRVASLLAQSETGSLDLSDTPDDQLRTTRADVVDELRLQQYLERRRSGERAVARQQAEAEAIDAIGEQAEDTEPEPEPGPKPRPGVAGAAEDLADALESGSDDRIDAATDRFRKALNRSRSDSPVVEELRAMLAPEAGAYDPEALRDAAQRLRDEQRAKRNAGARRRRTARRFERERLRSLLGQVEAEMRNRNLDYDPLPDDDGTITLDIAPAVAWSSRTDTESWSGASIRVDELSGANYQASISTIGNREPGYRWTVTDDNGAILATGSGTTSDVDSARVSVEVALDTQRKLGLIPIDAQIPQGSIPQDTSATPLTTVVDAVQNMRQRVIDGRQVNPITGQPDPFGDSLRPLPAPAGALFDDAGAVRKHIEVGVGGRAAEVASRYRWDTAKMTPGGAFVVLDNLKGKPEVVHSVSGATFNPTSVLIGTGLGRADLLRWAEIAEATRDRDGNPVDWSQSGRELSSNLRDRSFVADEDGLRGLQEAALRRLALEKLAAGAFTHKLVQNSSGYMSGVTNSTRKEFIADQHRALQHMITVRTGKPTTADKKTLEIAVGARTLASLGAPDTAAVLLTRRAAELREEHGADAPSRGSALLDALAQGYLGAFSPMRSHGERLGSLKAGERVFLADTSAEEGQDFRSFRVLAAPRRDPRGMPSDQIVPVIDEGNGDQKFLHVTHNQFRIEDTEQRSFGHAPLGGSRGDALVVVTGPGEEPPASVDDLTARRFDEVGIIPQDVLDAAAEALPESAGETAARRAAPSGGQRPPRRASARAPRRTAAAPAESRPVRNEEQLAQAQGRAVGQFLGMSMDKADNLASPGFDSLQEVREHLVSLAADNKNEGDYRQHTTADATVRLIDEGQFTLSPGGMFLISKGGFLTHARSGYKVWPTSPNTAAHNDMRGGGYETNAGAAAWVAEMFERGVFDGEQIDWRDGPKAVKQITAIGKRQNFSPLVTAQRRAYLDGVLDSKKPRITDVQMLRGMAGDVEGDMPNPEAMRSTKFVVEPLVDYDRAGGYRGGSYSYDAVYVADSKAGATLAKRVALEIRVAEAAAHVAPLDVVRRLNRVADELDGQTINAVNVVGAGNAPVEGNAPKTMTPSEDLRAIAQRITDAFDENKTSEATRFRRAGMTGQVEFSSPTITVNRRGWDSAPGKADPLQDLVSSNLEGAGGIRFYRDDNGMLHATFAGYDIADGQHGGRTLDGDSRPLNGSIKLRPDGTLSLSFIQASNPVIIEGAPGTWTFTPDTPENGDTDGDIPEPEIGSAQADEGDGVDISGDVQEMRRLADVDAEPGAQPATDSAPEVLEKQIRQVYDELAAGPQDWVRIARIRAKLGGADRAAFDETLLRMSRAGFVHLAPESNTKVLTPEDREGAVRMGSEDMHLIAIEPAEDAGPVDTETEIRQVYSELAPTPETWVRLARVRARLGTQDKAEVDRALLELMKTGTVHLSPDSNTKMLTEEDRAAAVRIGGEDLHLIAIE